MKDFSALLRPCGRKRVLKAIDNGDADEFVRLYSYFSAQAHLGADSEFDPSELQNHNELLAERTRVSLLCPSVLPTASESEKVRKVANCILGSIVTPEMEYLNAFLSLMWRKEISAEARIAMAECLKKFLPTHPDFFSLDSLIKRITVAMVGETGPTFRALDELLCAVNRRWAEAQAQSEPD